MIAVLLATLLVGAVSAFLPVTPVEPYLIAVVATTGDPPWPLGIAAGIGQTIGKLLIFLTARGALRSAWLRRRTTSPEGRGRPRKPMASATRPGTIRRWAAGSVSRLDRPRQATSVVFVSSVTGLPPLLLTSVYAARTSMSVVAFGVTCLVGRSIRFSVVASAPDLLHVLHLST